MPETEPELFSAEQTEKLGRALSHLTYRTQTTRGWWHQWFDRSAPDVPFMPAGWLDEWACRVSGREQGPVHLCAAWALALRTFPGHRVVVSPRRGARLGAALAQIVDMGQSARSQSRAESHLRVILRASGPPEEAVLSSLTGAVRLLWRQRIEVDMAGTAALACRLISCEEHTRQRARVRLTQDYQAALYERERATRTASA